MEHNGLSFPPDYVPHKVPIYYDGKPVKLNAEVNSISRFFLVSNIYKIVNIHVLFTLLLCFFSFFLVTLLFINVEKINKKKTKIKNFLPNYMKHTRL